MAKKDKLYRRRKKRTGIISALTSANFMMPLGGNGNGSGSSFEKQPDHPCYDCVHCCSYVATEIDDPTTMKDYDEILWFLYHKDVEVFVDWEGDWYIQFNSRCEQLTPAGLCGVYEERPYICADYDWRDCERNGPAAEPADRWHFSNATEFLSWFKKRRPRKYGKFVAYNETKWKKKKAKHERKLERVQELSLVGH